MDRRQFGKTIAATTVAAAIPTGAAVGTRTAVPADRILIEIGYGWISPNQLIKPCKRSIAHVRTRLRDKYGLHLPFCSVRDDLSLDPFAFRVSYHGRMRRFGFKPPQTLACVNLDRKTRIAFPAEESVDDFGFQRFWVPSNQLKTAKAAGLCHVSFAHFLAVDAAAAIFDIKASIT